MTIVVYLIFVFYCDSGKCAAKPYLRGCIVILKKVTLGGIQPNGNMLTVNIGPIQYN